MSSFSLNSAQILYLLYLREKRDTLETAYRRSDKTRSHPGNGPSHTSNKYYSLNCHERIRKNSSRKRRPLSALRAIRLKAWRSLRREFVNSFRQSRLSGVSRKANSTSLDIWKANWNSLPVPHNYIKQYSEYMVLLTKATHASTSLSRILCSIKTWCRSYVHAFHSG